MEATLERQRVRAWWRIVRDAVAGRSADPATGPIGPAIVGLAVPMVLEMAMESVFAVVDILFVSRLGPAAVAAVGLTESVIAIVYTVAMGLSIGVMAVVARRTGERDADGAAVATVQAIALGAATAVAIGVIGVMNAPRILALMGAAPDVVGTGAGYAAVMLGGNGAILLLFMLNAAFRGSGDAAVAMRVLWLANGLNIVLDPLLIFGIGPFPELGVTGAAIATTFSRGVGVGLQLWLLFRGSGRLRIAPRHVRVQLNVLAHVLRLSGTGMLQTFISTASWIGLVRVLAGFGSQALAGYTIAIRVVLFALLPAWGLSNAAATLVGQSLGAGDAARAERAVYTAARFNIVLLGAVGLLFLGLAPGITAIFGGDTATLDTAVRCLRIVALRFPFYALAMVVAQSFNGAGDVWTPTLLNLLCFWFLELPLAWLLAHGAGIGPDGVFAAIAIAFSTLAVAGMVVFRRGRWKRARV
jgi:putative MATE family efflux protein